MEALDVWLAGHEPTEDGVPLPGEVHAVDEEHVEDADDAFQGGGGEGDSDDAALQGLQGNKRLRRSNATAASCDQKLLAIVTHLGTPANNAPGFNALLGTLSGFIKRTMTVDAVHEAVKTSLGPVSRNATGWNAYAKILDRHLTAVTAQAPVVAPGRPTTNRFKAHYEGGGGAAPSQQRTPSSSQSGVHASAAIANDQRPSDWDQRFEGKTKHAAWAYLGRWGAKENWIVEVFPDDRSSLYALGDRWFLRIKNGRVEGTEGDQWISSCRWMKKNSFLQLDPAYPDAVRVELRQVKHYGPPDCKLFQ
jgi:hypothetical protein